MMFKIKPVFAILGIVKYPLAKTIALGGVPTGIIKENEAASVAGIISKYGCTPSTGAAAANTGRSMVICAVFDIISEKKVVAKQSSRMT